MALLLPDMRNPFFAELAASLEAVSVGAGFTFSVFPTGDCVEREQAQLEQLARMGVCAVALVPASDQQPALRRLSDRGVATVVIDRDLPGVPADCVYCDGEAGAFMAVSHLIGLGHKRIACITGPARTFECHVRMAGYRAAMRAAGLSYDAVVMERESNSACAVAATRRLIESPLPPTAIFAFNDLMAIGVLHAARSMGLHLPEELSVIGFDDIAMAAIVNPPLTTIEQPIDEMGRLAGAMLLERIADPSLPYRRAMLPTRLSVRGSTAPPG